MKNYENMVTAYAKPSYYGGRVFIKYNTKTKKYYIGNTASTAVSDNNSAIRIDGLTQKAVKDIARQLKNIGYKEYNVVWGGKIDAYTGIERAGL